MSRFDYDEDAGNQPGPMWRGDQQLTWAEIVEATREEGARLAKWATLVSDLDRSPNGRHEGDAEFQDPSGVSQGNPHIQPGEVIGYTISGGEIAMPVNIGDRNDPDKWIQ